MRIKITFLLCFTFCSALAFGGSDIVVQYKIVSDKIDTSLTPGTCLVIGTVSHRKKVVANGLVGSTIGANDTKTDSLGQYRLTVTDLDSVVYFYKPFYQEIAITPFDFKSQHVVVIDFYATEKVIRQAMKKPVIYFYPEKEMEVKVDLQVKGDLTFTYPAIEDGWSFQISPDGTIHKGESSYPYLFWEGVSANLTFDKLVSSNSIQGTLVQDNQVISFLESQLSLLGLNDKERADFITFWGPDLSKNKTSFVQFIVDEQVTDLIGALTVSPAPISFRRVYILFCNSDNITYQIVSPAPIKPFVRSGFTVLEWGGTAIKMLKGI
jgi:hypothetical protein